jgi:hypothetical protein
MLSGSLKNIQETVAFLAKMQSLETNREASKGKRVDPNWRDPKRGPPRDRYYDSGANRRPDTQMRHVRYARNEDSRNLPYRQGASNRGRNWLQYDRGRNNTPRSSLNARAHEFEPSNTNPHRQEGSENNTWVGTPNNM